MESALLLQNAFHVHVGAGGDFSTVNASNQSEWAVFEWLIAPSRVSS